MIEAVWVSDGNCHLTDADVLRVAESRPWQSRAVDAKNGEVRVGIGTDAIGRQRPAVRQRDGDSSVASAVSRTRTVVVWSHNMTVRQDEAIRREDHTGAAAPLPFDADDGWPNLFDGMDDGIGIGVQQRAVIVLVDWVIGQHGRSSHRRVGRASPEWGGMSIMAGWKN